MQGQRVTLGSLGMKTHTAVQVKEVTSSLFFYTNFSISISQGEKMVGTNICKKMAAIKTVWEHIRVLNLQTRLYATT